MVEGGMTCIKYILGVFNFVFVVFGILLVVLGGRALTEAETARQVLDSMNAFTTLSIVCGVLLFIIAFLGCCGALRENHCMLVSFSVIVFIILVTELIIGGLMIAFKNEVEDLALHRLKGLMDEYKPGAENDTTTTFIDEVQTKLHCCGLNNYTDWKTQFNLTTGIPESCCPQVKESEINKPINETCTAGRAYNEGCVEAISRGMKDIYGLLGGVAITVAVIQLLGVIFACCLAYAVRKEYEVV